MFTHMLKTSDPMRSAWRWVVLLVLLGFPLACDRTPTAPTSQPGPRVEGSFLPPPLLSSGPYYGINVQLAAQQQYGPSATAVEVSGHLYGWRAVVNGTQYSIDMARAVRDQFGSGYILGAVGVGIYDWRAVHWSALSHEVLPVVVIASDYFWNPSAVQAGLANFESVIGATQTWYNSAIAAAGSLFGNITFHQLQPLVVFLQSPYTAAQWNAFSAGEPGMLWSMAWNVYATAYPPNSLGGSTGTAVRVVLGVFTGSSPTVFGGAQVEDGWYNGSILPGVAVVPPAVTSLSCSWGIGGTGLSSPCQHATYWVAHELGYTFGLKDCPSWDSTCSSSIMGNGEPPSAFLEWGQAYTLSTSGFFF